MDIEHKTQRDLMEQFKKFGGNLKLSATQVRTMSTFIDGKLKEGISSNPSTSESSTDIVLLVPKIEKPDLDIINIERSIGDKKISKSNAKISNAEMYGLFKALDQNMSKIVAFSEKPDIETKRRIIGGFQAWLDWNMILSFGFKNYEGVVLMLISCLFTFLSLDHFFASR